MSYCEENRFQPKLICNKGDMLLTEIKSFNYNTKSYNLVFTVSNIDANITNVNNLTGLEIYNLLEMQNKELIEKIVIINDTNNEADICILIQHIAKEIGIKQKYMLFRTTKIVNKFNNSVTFYNKDLKLICEQLKEDYLKQLGLINSNYEALTYNYGKTQINVQKDNNELMSVKFNIDFQVTIDDDLPLYMENLVGLMFKKMFYNLKNYYCA
jgi:galactitol-specific phosphotransferase system IIB component